MVLTSVKGFSQHTVVMVKVEWVVKISSERGKTDNIIGLF